MAISDKTRKVLWGRSGNRCAICRKELVLEAISLDDRSVVGEECHIVSGQENGPRFDEKYPKDRTDAYDNLILLCRNHHKMVDDQYETYTVDLLCQIKTNHEKWVSERLNEEVIIKPIRIKRVKDNIPKYLIRLTSGKEVLNIVDGAEMFSFDHDELESEAEVELIGSLIQTARDWGNLGPDLEPADKVRIGFQLTLSIKELEEAGFFVFGAKEVQMLEGGALPGPSDWTVATLRILRKTNELIIFQEIDETDRI